MDPLKKVILKSMLSLLVGLPLWSAGARADLAASDPCVRVRIALDMGSGATKARSGVVNICTQRVLAEISRGDVPLPFKDHLSSRPVEDKSFTSEFMAEAEGKIADLIAKVRAETVEKLKAGGALASYAELAASPIEVAGVATEAFRQSVNAPWFVWKMSRTHKVHISVISQAQEGHLGFMGALSALNLKGEVNPDPSRVVSWDIGGGSLQMVAYNGLDQGGHWLDFGNKLASNPMRLFVMESFKHAKPFKADKTPVSPNPIISPQLSFSDWTAQARSLKSAASHLAAEQFKPLLDAGWMSPQAMAAAGRSVYGIGGVHNGIIKFLRNQKGHEKDQGYSRRDLQILLEQLLSANDARLTAAYKVKPEFASATVTNILLVNTVMDTLGIERVNVLDVDNTFGAMIAPSFWGASPVLSAASSTHAILDP
jgi:hypothetical protein